VTLSTFKQKLKTYLCTVISRHVISPHIDVQWLQCFCICSLKIMIDWLIQRIGHRGPRPATKFANDTKVFGTVIDEDDRTVLQEDLQKLSEWADSWQMEFNVEKCKVMHFGSRNNKFNYSMRGNSWKWSAWKEILVSSLPAIWKWRIIVNKHMPQRTECWGLSHERSNTGTSALWYTSTKVWFGLT